MSTDPPRAPDMALTRRVAVGWEHRIRSVAEALRKQAGGAICPDASILEAVAEEIKAYARSLITTGEWPARVDPELPTPRQGISRRKLPPR
jgi:hypothetical protein